MKKLVEYAIFELIKNIVPPMTIGDKVFENPVFALQAPQGATGPFVIYQRIDGERWRAMNNPSGMAQVSIQIDVYATSYFEAKQYSSLIETALDGFRDIVYYGDDSPRDFVRIAGISLSNETELFDQTDQPWLYRSETTYLVTFEQ